MIRLIIFTALLFSFSALSFAIGREYGLYESHEYVDHANSNVAECWMQALR